MKYVIAGFLVVIFAVACKKNSRPDQVLQEAKMISVLTDIHVVDAYLNSSAQYDPATQPPQNYYQVIYRKYKTDSAQVEKSLKYYSKQPRLLDTMYHQVLQNLQRMEITSNLAEQQRNRKLELLNQKKRNAEIRLKPQPHWFFKYDTAAVFENRKPFIPR